MTRGKTGLCIGGMTRKQRIESLDQPIMIGTFAQAKEGLDIEELDALVFCGSCSKPAQPVGRILRREQYDEPPIVIDMVDQENEVLAARFQKRARCYRKHQYNIQEYLFQDHDVEKGHRIRGAKSTREYPEIREMLHDCSTHVEEPSEDDEYDPFADI